MARAALKWSAAELAGAAGIGYATVARFEGGQAVASESVNAMERALSNAGVEFIPSGTVIRAASSGAGAGVRLRGVRATQAQGD